jgi:hypothetical protein
VGLAALDPPYRHRRVAVDRTDDQPDPPLDLVAEWLTRPISVEEVAELSWPDLWLKDWFDMLARMRPGDELWEYSGQALEHAGDSIDPTNLVTYAGFARVRDGRVVEYLPTDEDWC